MLSYNIFYNKKYMWIGYKVRKCYFSVFFFFSLKKNLKEEEETKNKERKKPKSLRAHSIVYLIRMILIWFWNLNRTVQSDRINQNRFLK